MLRRAGGVIWSASVSAKAMAINLGNFRDEILAARAHDLAALLFCGTSSYRKLNFQEWTYKDDLARMQKLDQVCPAHRCASDLSERHGDACPTRHMLSGYAVGSWCLSWTLSQRLVG
jgi:hypothetical protein